MLIPVLACAFVLLIGGNSFAQDHEAHLDSSETQVTKAKDPWLGIDKANHFTVSVVLTGASYYALRGELNLSHENSLAGAAATAMMIGIAKEVHDGISGKGTPSIKDVIADVIGIGVAAALVNR